MVTKSNTELVKLLKKGDMIAFDLLYKKFSGRLFRFVISYVKQQEDAEEIIQDVFFKIWESRKKIDEYSSFNSFIFTMAYNKTINLLKKRLQEKKYLDYLELRQQIYDSESFIDEIQFKELNDKANKLLDNLTPRQKEIYLLSREKGLTYSEIGSKLNISVNTVKNHMVSVLSYLRNKLGKNLIMNILFVYLFI